MAQVGTSKSNGPVKGHAKGQTSGSKTVKTSHIALSSGIGAFVAHPTGELEIKGGLILVQEIFGVNSHIRNLAVRYAERGLFVMAPSYFDRAHKDLDVGYDEAGREAGFAAVKKTSIDMALKDTKVAAGELKRILATGHDKVAVLGFCWGGSVAWMSACRLEGCVDAAVGYYGSMVLQYPDESPKLPVMLHFGEKDEHIPVNKVKEFKGKHPNVPVFIYEDAEHGFNCDERPSYNAQASALADGRSMEFLAPVMGAGLQAAGAKDH